MKEPISTLLVTCVTIIKLGQYFLPKTSTYVKVLMDKRNGCIFWLKIIQQKN